MRVIPSFDYKCSTEGCNHQDWEVRPRERRDDPLECPQCKGNMVYEFPDEIPVVNIIDRKTLLLPGRAPITRTRKRSLGTQIGLIRPVEIGNALHDMESKYSKDIAKAEAEDLKPKKES